jgi:hypothetical protein
MFTDNSIQIIGGQPFAIKLQGGNNCAACLLPLPHPFINQKPGRVPFSPA